MKNFIIAIIAIFAFATTASAQAPAVKQEPTKLKVVESQKKKTEAKVVKIKPAAPASENASPVAKAAVAKPKPVTPAVNAPGPLKKDGTPDKRYKSNKKLKKDGTPDMRYKQNKKN